MYGCLLFVPAYLVNLTMKVGNYVVMNNGIMSKLLLNLLHVLLLNVVIYFMDNYEVRFGCDFRKCRHRKKLTDCNVGCMRKQWPVFEYTNLVRLQP